MRSPNGSPMPRYFLATDTTSLRFFSMRSSRACLSPALTLLLRSISSSCVSSLSRPICARYLASGSGASLFAILVTPSLAILYLLTKPFLVIGLCGLQAIFSSSLLGAVSFLLALVYRDHPEALFLTLSWTRSGFCPSAPDLDPRFGSRPHPHRSRSGGPRTSRGSPRTYPNDHGPAASPLQNPIRRTLSLRNGPSARSTRRNRSHARASRLGLASVCRGHLDPTLQISCSTSDVLDSLLARGLTLRRRLPAPPVEGVPQPPCAASASCGRRAAACRERSDWCPYASLPRLWASPPGSPLLQPRAVYPSVLCL